MVRFCKDFSSFEKAFEKNRPVQFDSTECRKFIPFDQLKVPLLSLAFTHSNESANAVTALLGQHFLKLKDYKFFR
jgi:hypothetical protein